MPVCVSAGIAFQARNGHGALSFMFHCTARIQLLTLWSELQFSISLPFSMRFSGVHGSSSKPTCPSRAAAYCWGGKPASAYALPHELMRASCQSNQIMRLICAATNVAFYVLHHCRRFNTQVAMCRNHIKLDFCKPLPWGHFN